MMTVGLQRAQAHLLSQGEGLTVMGGGLVDVRGIAMHGNVAKQTAGVRLVAVSWVGAGEGAEAVCKRARLVHTANAQACLTQFGEHALMGKHTTPGGNTLQHLCQKRQGLSSMPSEGICRSQDRGN